MTIKEQQAIEQVHALLAEIKKENMVMAEQLKQAVTQTNGRLDQKLVPVSLEQDILTSVQQSLHKVIVSDLTGYASPLHKLIVEVVNSHSAELRTIVNDAFEAVIQTEDFKADIRDAFAHKVARTLISNQQGLLDKVSNELRQDATFKSKVTLAIANVVNECLDKG